MKRTAICLALTGLLAMGGQAIAEICTIDDVPAATLLLPYFEVDLDSTDGITTLFSVNNASATAVLTHVVVWTDLSVPVLDFNLYLTGYDVQTINMRDIVNGRLPITASAGQDTGGDTISPQGTFSDDINFTSCNGFLPPAAQQPASFVAHLQASLTGNFSSLLGGCAGRDLGDNIARGYVTIDTVRACTLDFPGDAGYFVAGGTGTATNQNVLWGDYFYVEPGENFAQGETLAHIEASPATLDLGPPQVDGPASPETTVAGEYTFYGRYVNWTAADNREPLATTFATRYINGGLFTGGTDLIVWRDSKRGDDAAFKCGTLPTWYPLGQEQIVIFNEQEEPVTPEGCTVSPCPTEDILIPFPAEAQRTLVGGPDLPVPFDFGWLYLDLNFQPIGATTVPPEDPLALQNWVTTIMSAEDRFAVGFDAIKLDSACNASHVIIGD